LQKQLSAPKFRLKGAGWYETDFKTGDKRNIAGDSDNKSEAKSETKAETKSKDSATTSKKTAAKPSKPESKAKSA
jgi:predicted nucleic acid-binding Zn ribbon protein